MTNRIKFSTEAAAAFRAYPGHIRPKMKYLRQLILETASEMNTLGGIEESLKWGEPSYKPVKPKTGSGIRIDWKRRAPDEYCMYFKCTANLVPAFKKKFPHLTYGGTRSIHLSLKKKVPVTELKSCIGLALTYHLNKKLSASQRWKMVEVARIGGH